MKKFLSVLLTAGVLTLGAGCVSAPAGQPTPTSTALASSVIHVVTVAWKDGTKPEQIQAALDGAQKLPSLFKGITRVWTRSIKVQGGKANAIVMEFASEQALKDYDGSDAQKEWYKVYLTIREESTTFDITN